MSLYKFEAEDVLDNRIKAYPDVKFVIYTGSIYYNDKVDEFGISNGDIVLGELSTIKAFGGDVYQFVTKDSSRVAWKTISVSSFNSDFNYGDVLSSSLPLTASIQSQYFPFENPRLHVDALKNVSNFYTSLNNNYYFSSSLGDKSTQIVRLISFPSIFYGSSIKKGSVSLKFYMTGTLLGELQDKNRNGALIQVGPDASTGSGSVGGVVYYNEGFILLTGSWDINSSTDNYEGSSNPRWVDFACLDDGLGTAPQSSSYGIEMKGTQHVPVKTLLAHADKGHLNHSNNSTFIAYGQSGSTATNPFGADSGSLGYYEKSDLKIKNVVKYAYNNDTGSFKKETYISKIGIYDDERNLIGIAKLATPVRKRENDQFTFKLKLDI